MLYIDMKRLRAMNQPTFTKTNSLRTQTYFPSSQTIFVTEATTGNTSALAQMRAVLFKAIYCQLHIGKYALS